MAKDWSFFSERLEHDSSICAMHADSFGPGRFVRAAVLLREQGMHDLSLSFLCAEGKRIVGSVRMTPISIEKITGHLLGPIVVHPLYQNKGIGRKLISMSVDAAEKKGSQVIVLVGDIAYYSKLGFQAVPWKSLILPAPVDPNRVLFLPLVQNVAQNIKGIVRCREEPKIGR
ncbi:GNAT family N-acetyltransferase, partial [Candidatus Liberibacter asiaticus]|uniref:GNAT family N-acetyltransferase n=1 Tax=Liberibacter asiaticus TaxID=34021 RepID=UPI0012F4EFDE